MKPNAIPLCVDLDGTLLKTDTLYELALRVLKKSFWTIFYFPFLLLKGKQNLKKYLSENSKLDPGSLPYNQDFLNFLIDQHTKGRILVLVTGCYEKTANEIARHLNIFSDVIATTSDINLTGQKKAKCLVEKYGENSFDYAGNERVDQAVWKVSREKILVNCLTPTAIMLGKKISFTHVFDTRQFRIKPFIKAIRLHQWAKNLLIFIPALTAHALLDKGNILILIQAFLAFGCCASFSYVVNDLLDLDADRQHRSKKYRPFAAGTVSILSGASLIIILLGLALALSVQLNIRFFELLLLYFITTNLYSFKLKSIPILDVSILAGLYTLRVIAGSVVVGLDPTFWLVAFSAFLFFSLAIVKRLSELLYLDKNSDKPVKARGYVAEDISTLQALGCSAAMAAVLVLALYIDSTAVKVLYASPRQLWLLCPAILIWLGRVWLVTGRGEMHDDPVVFALKDRISWLIFFVGACVLLSAKFF